MCRWSILQPYYVYSKMGERLFACSLYFPNNAAVKVIKLDRDQYGLSKDKARRVRPVLAMLLSGTCFIYRA